MMLFSVGLYDFQWTYAILTHVNPISGQFLV